MHKMWRFLKNDVHVCLCVSAGLLGGGPTTEEDHISAGESTSPSSALPGEDHGQSEVVVAAFETLLHETTNLLLRISGSECASNSPSHTISTNN